MLGQFLVTAERERCSVPCSGNGRSGTGTRERFRSHSVKMHRKRHSCSGFVVPRSIVPGTPVTPITKQIVPRVPLNNIEGPENIAS